MNLENLVKYLRFEILDDFVSGWESMVEGDQSSELLWSNESLARYINEAQVQAARRSCLIKDFTSYTIDLIVNEAEYKLNPKIVRVLDVDLVSTGLPIDPIEYGDLRTVQNWRTETGTVTNYLIDYEGKKILFYRIPTVADTANLTVYRLPKEELSWDGDLSAEPEIREEYHIPMLHYAAFLAYSKQDVDTYDTQKAASHYAQFAAEFSDTSAYSETRKRREGKRTVKYGGEYF